MSKRLATIVLGLAVLTAAAAHARETLYPLGEQRTTPIGKNATAYYDVGNAPLVVPVVGPGTLSGFARMPMPGPDADEQPGTLIVGGLLAGPVELSFVFKVSANAAWNDDRAGVPSSGRRIELEVPAGNHRLSLTAASPLLVVLYWDGPPQPETPGLSQPLTAKATGSAGAKGKASAWDLRGAFGVGFIYNDNILTAGIDDVDGFESGIAPYRYEHETTDDLVVAPSLELEARRNLVAWGQTRFRGKVKRWTYTHNAIKTNTDFDFYLRQYFGKKQSLELYLHAAPEQYIRQLSDRSPLDDPEGSLEYKEFRFQRNIWNLTWRQQLTRDLDAKVLFERNYRYYNQPFMENDIEAWEVRANLTWDITKVFRFNVDYSFEDAAGRGVDEVGETPATSDNSDPSYERDLYRAELQIKAPALKKWIDRISLTFLYMDYYYTADKPLVEDPYHVGRRDEFTKLTFAVQRRVARPLTVKLATRRTERITKSPWEGDLTTDKAFVQWLYWVDLTYRF